MQQLDDKVKLKTNNILNRCPSKFTKAQTTNYFRCPLTNRRKKNQTTSLRYLSIFFLKNYIYLSVWMSY